MPTEWFITKMKHIETAATKQAQKAQAEISRLASLAEQYRSQLTASYIYSLNPTTMSGRFEILSHRWTQS